MYKRITFAVLILILSGISLHPVFASGSTVTCGDFTRTAGISLNLTTTAHSNNGNIPIMVTGLSNFRPLASSGNSSECIATRGADYTLNLPTTRTHSISHDVYTQARHGASINMQVANRDTKGRDVMIIFDNLYYNNSSDILTLSFGSHLMHADVYMLSRSSNPNNAQLGLINTVVSTSYGKAHTCSDFGVKHCLPDWSSYNLSYSKLDSSIRPQAHSGSFHSTDSSVSLNRAHAHGGRDVSVNLSANTPGYYTLIVHFRCRHHCHNAK